MSTNTRFDVHKLVEYTIPTSAKPTLPRLVSERKVIDIATILEYNYKAVVTEDAAASFSLNNQGRIVTTPISVNTYRLLTALYRTIGRLPDEMEALCYMQLQILKNINNLKTDTDLIKFLESIKPTTECLALIKDKMLIVCEPQT
jgi:hypothetical protein